MSRPPRSEAGPTARLTNPPASRVCHWWDASFPGFPAHDRSGGAPSVSWSPYQLNGAVSAATLRDAEKNKYMNGKSCMLQRSASPLMDSRRHTVLSGVTTSEVVQPADRQKVLQPTGRTAQEIITQHTKYNAPQNASMKKNNDRLQRSLLPRNCFYEEIGFCIAFANVRRTMTQVQGY